MKNHTVLIVTAVVAVAAMLLVGPRFKQDEPAGYDQTVTANAHSGELGDLKSVLIAQQQAAESLSREILREQKRLGEALADLEGRLKTLEASSTVSSNGDSGAGDPFAGGISFPDYSISEAEVGNWMDRNLQPESVDLESTETARLQTQQILGGMPGVNLEDMRCGKEYCKAVFTHVSGEHPGLRGLYGNPPYMYQAFTVNEDDGSVTLYFTREEDADLDAFRLQAQNAYDTGSQSGGVGYSPGGGGDAPDEGTDQ